MPNESCLTTGYHLKCAIRILNGPPLGKRLARRERRRGLSYGKLQRSLDPFQLAKVIDKKLERIYRLANRRLSPQAQAYSQISQAQSGRRRALSGYISNGATWIALVTFSNGLTREARHEEGQLAGQLSPGLAPLGESSAAVLRHADKLAPRLTGLVSRS